MTRRRFHRRIYLGILRKQRLVCACGCLTKFTKSEGYEFNHVVGLWEGGKDVPENIEALRVPCHKPVTKRQAFERAKAKRIARKRAGIWRKPKGRKIQSRGFQSRPGEYKWPKRSFQTRSGA